MHRSKSNITQNHNPLESISKEAIQRIHEQIFGSPFSLKNVSHRERLSPRNQSPKIRFLNPEISLKHGETHKIYFKRANDRSNLAFYLDLDYLNRPVVQFRTPNFADGFLPGDTILSLNGVDFHQLSIDEMNSKLSSKGPSGLKLVISPSEESIEWSVRSIHVDFSSWPMLTNGFLGTSGPQGFDYTDFMSKQDHCTNRLCFREWIQKYGSLKGSSLLVSKMYEDLLKSTAQDANKLCSAGDMVLVTHREGYSMGKVVEILPGESYQIMLFPNKQIITLNSDDINRTNTLQENGCYRYGFAQNGELSFNLRFAANSRELEGMEDLMLLQYQNEVALVFNLHARFLNGLPYTYAGDFALLAFNPMRSLDIYNDAVKHLFLDCQHRLDMPPHIYSLAQTILIRMERAFATRKKHSQPTFRFDIHLSKRMNGARGDDGSDDSDIDYRQRERVSIATLTAAAIKVPTQAVCLFGRSGSGKSVNTEHLLEYIFYSNRQGSKGSHLTDGKVRAVMCLLDAFTCSRTLLNSNASRCLRLFTVEFSGDLSSSTTSRPVPSSLYVDLLLLDKFRVTRRPQGEPTFHVFYYFLAGLEKDLRSEYRLEDLTAPNLFMTPLQRPEDQKLARTRWQAVREAARVLGSNFEDAFLKGVCRLLAAIYHLGCAGATPPSKSASVESLYSQLQGKPASATMLKRHFINQTAAERAARLLGCPSVERLAADVFGAATAESNHRAPNNLELLGGFVANLYAIATNTLRDLINKALNPSSGGLLRSSSDMEVRSRATRLVVVDPPGLQTPEAGGRMSGGSFEDLLYNYTNECLLQLYRQCQSQLDDSGNISSKNPGFVEFLDTPPENPFGSLRRSLANSRYSMSRLSESPTRPGSSTFMASDDESSVFTLDRNGGMSTMGSTVALPDGSGAQVGFLWLLDYACSTGDVKGFLKLAAQKYAMHKTTHLSRDSRLLRRLHRSGAFSLNHWNATAVVQYHPSTWLSSCRFANNPRTAIDLLQKSTLPLLRSIGDAMDEGASASTLSVSSSAGLVESFISDTKYVMDLLRICCSTNSGGLNGRSSSGGSINGDVGDSSNGVEAYGGTRSDMHWVHCILPVVSAGLWQVNASQPPPPMTKNCSATTAGHPHARFCVPLVRAQLHGLELATDLAYLKPAFTRQFDPNACPTPKKSEAEETKAAPTPTHSVSEDLITVTEQNANVQSAAPPTPLDANTEPGKASELETISHSDAGINHTPGEPADTYNFVFNTTTNNFPWEQLLSLAPVDRGLIKQLRFQLEEMEEAKELLQRKHRALTAALEDCQQQLNQEQRDRRAVEARYQTAQREIDDLQNRLEEMEEELEETCRRQRRLQLSSTSSGDIVNGEVNELIEERDSLREEIANLQERLSRVTNEKAGAADMEIVQLKAKINELEGRLELENSTKQRLQATVDRLRGQMESVKAERDRLSSSLQSERVLVRQLNRNLREAVEDKERAERRLAEEEMRRNEASNEVSNYVHEQMRLQQELNQLLLRCKEEELRSVLMRSRQLTGEDDSDEESEDLEELEDGDAERGGRSSGVYVSDVEEASTAPATGGSNGKPKDITPVSGNQRDRRVLGSKT